MKIVFTGGGTGGHIYPIIAITREIKKAYSGKEKLDLLYLGPKSKTTFVLLNQEGVKTKPVLAGKIRRYVGIMAFIQNFIDLFKILFGVLLAFRYLFFSIPDLVFTKGGYGSFPVVIAARILRIPVFLHESDAILGLANKILRRFSARTFISFPKTSSQ